MRTAGVHAGGGDCNRAVEVCVSGFGNPNRNRGGDNPGERFQRVLQRSVGGRVCRVQARRDAQKKDVSRSCIQAIGQERQGKKTQQQYTRTRAEVFAMTRKRELVWKEIQVCQSVRRVESSRGRTGEWVNGGRGGKETSRPGQIERGRRGAGGQAQASEEGRLEWAVGGKMRRKCKCGRWEGATDGGRRANSQLSLAEPSQTGMSAFPQVGAAWTLGEAASQRPSAREGCRDQGRWGLALGLGLGLGRAAAQVQGSSPPGHSHHTVCPSCLCVLVSVFCPSDGVAQASIN